LEVRSAAAGEVEAPMCINLAGEPGSDDETVTREVHVTMDRKARGGADNSIAPWSVVLPICKGFTLGCWHRMSTRVYGHERHERHGVPAW
jgi:hypothetical protein